jgi:hypothetical protein
LFASFFLLGIEVFSELQIISLLFQTSQLIILSRSLSVLAPKCFTSICSISQLVIDIEANSRFRGSEVAAV